MAYKKWRVSSIDKQAANRLSEECDVDPFVALIASARGYSDPTELEEFLSDDPVLASPFELPSMQVAADAVRQAIEEDKLIAVFGDYDCDGITATALLYKFLVSQGARVMTYIPSRLEEGYGMSTSAVDKLNASGVKMIITVDNGVSCADEISYADSLGIKTVVTDHHLPPENIPNAVAVVDPHLPGCCAEFKDISGVFVAFKLACAVSGAEPEEILPQYADLLAIGLIADVMPLKYENRAAVKSGILCINNSNDIGISALISVAGLKKGGVTAGNIAFALAPRLNAAGRMGDADSALQLLLTDDSNYAAELAEKLDSYNSERQKTEQSILKEAVEIIEKNRYQHDRVIVVCGNGWHHGVVGIVASRIVEKYGKPTILLSCVDDECSGSGRSIEGFSLYDALSSAADILIKFGGHAMAAGLTVSENNVEILRRRLLDYAAGMPDVSPVLNLDCKLNPAGINLDLVESISQLEPFGTGNPSPLFGIYGLTVERISPLGASGNHCKLLLSRGGNTLQALAFGITAEAFPFSQGDMIDIAVSLDINSYNGNRTVAVIIKNYRKSGIDEDKFFQEIALYDSFRRGETADYPQLQREEILQVYRSAKTPLPPEKLRQHLLGTPGYFKTSVSLDVLEELGLLNCYEDAGTRMISSVSGKKADLADSKILSSLRG